MRASVVIALTAACLLAADSENKASQERLARQNLERWQGTFAAQSIVNEGLPLPPEELAKRKLTVKDHEYHFQNGDYSEHGTYKFDLAKTPKQLDIIVGDGPDKGKVYLAIFETSQQGIVICLDNANAKRPRSAAAVAGSGLTVELWRRVKP